MTRYFKIVLSFVITVGVIFVLAEISTNIYIYYFADEDSLSRYASITQLARIFNKDKNKLRITPHPYTVYTLSPNYEEGCNKHNLYGFRGKELGTKEDGEIWIACLGESTTYDYDIECWEKAYPAQLEKYLNEQGVKAKVINAGVDGWTSFEILIDFNLRVSRLPIDILIYYGGFNDIIFTRLVHPIPKNPLERDITCARWGIDGMFNYPFWETSSVMRIILVKLGYAIPHFDLFSMHLSPQNCFIDVVVQLLNRSYPEGIFKDIPIENILLNNPPIWFEQNLTNLVLLAKSKSIIPILTTYALNKSKHNNHFIVRDEKSVAIINRIMSFGIKEMNSVIEKIAKEQNIPILDLDNSYPVDGNLFTDLIHNNEQGAQIKAELIAKFLINSHIINLPKHD